MELEDLFLRSNADYELILQLEHELAYRTTKRASILRDNVAAKKLLRFSQGKHKLEGNPEQRPASQARNGCQGNTRTVGNMLIHDVAQGTPEWFEARLGIPTASQFCKIITPRGLASIQANAYLENLVIERITGRCYQTFAGNEWTERGKELEPEAVRVYEKHMKLTTVKVGFVTDLGRTMGCSPDRLVGDDGLLEVKCPAPHTHAKYLENQWIDMKYYPQVQGQLLVTGRKWVDLFSYHPDQKQLRVRFARDERYIAILIVLLREFQNKLSERIKHPDPMPGPMGASNPLSRKV